MPRLTIFLIFSGLSGLTGWATGWGLHIGYWLVMEVKFVTNQTNYITAVSQILLPLLSILRPHRNSALTQYTKSHKKSVILEYAYETMLHGVYSTPRLRSTHLAEEKTGS